MAITSLLDLWQVAPAWRDLLAETLAAHPELVARLDELEQDDELCPPTHQRWACLEDLTPASVRVVILGQDPYPTPGHAHGLAFSLGDPELVLPRSLTIIYKELAKDVGSHPTGGNLDVWRQQGVLLLNPVLSTLVGERNAHAKIGWQTLTGAVMAAVVAAAPDAVWLTWGGPAAKLVAGLDPQPRHIIATSHPSPLGFKKTASPFWASRCFSRCNTLLQDAGLEPINW